MNFMGISKILIVSSLLLMVSSLTAVVGAEEESSVSLPDIGCIKCHIELGEPSGQIVDEWLHSYHAEFGNTCDGCHGGNPKSMEPDEAMSVESGFTGVPDEKEIPSFCGKCHDGVREEYMKSDHGIDLQQDKVTPSCVYCHGSHGVRRAKADLINEEKCSLCHEYDRALQIKGAMSELESDIEEKFQSISELKEEGMQPSGVEDRLFDTRNTFHRISHELRVAVVLDITHEMKEKLTEIDETIHDARSEISKRRTLGLLFIILCAVTVVLISAYRKTLH